MTRNGEEPNRFLGFSWEPGSRVRQDEEQQRVLGIPVSWFGQADLSWLHAMAHPVRGYRRWRTRRRLGIYAPDDDDP
ncbi:MAG: hypothetical protein ACLQDY_23585 [Streptosporangiaceae bacterium]